MNLIIYFVLVVLAVLIVVLILFRNRRENIEINDALLGPEELEKHAVDIARNHISRKSKRGLRSLEPRINDNYKYIHNVYKTLNSDVKNMVPTVPAAEWLLDNYYIIEEQVKDIKNNLSKGGYSALPILKNGYLRGYPRVFAIALELVAHTDGMVDEKVLNGFLKAYQSQVPLSIEELWSVAIMIRIALIENIRHICEKIINSQQQWCKSEELAEFITNNMDKTDEKLVDLIDERIGNMRSIGPSFVEHLLQKLRKKSGKVSAIIHYFDIRLEEQDFSTEFITTLEHQLQAARQISIGNTITSLRLISTMDWADTFESLSLVENILRQDPAGIYPEMDFESRDYYRSAVQKIAKKMRATQIQVAKRAIECALQNTINQDEGLQSHVGYYLVGKGIKCLEKRTGSKKRKYTALADTLRKHPAALYLGSIVIITLLISACFAYYGGWRYGGFSLVTALLSALVVLIPASDLAVGAVNCAVSYMCRPHILPKLELMDGIPETSSTMVIIPTLLPNEKRVKEIVDQLEIFYLANRERNLFFGLVGDYKDAPEKDMPGDDRITAAALEGIKKLNHRYADENRDTFFYFHRHRQYNNAQNKWMGWERKRGAIMEFNNLLRGNTDTSYSIVSGDLSKLPYIKYVITLDADTQLPMGAARKLVGALSHPLNKAKIDNETGIVLEGYGLLQPRISVSVISANSTLFSRIFAGQGGIDPYTTAVSDVYQDVFGEGIFTGKGIFEVDVFQKALSHAIPENTVLSHDLLEGSYVRTGLVTDIELVDGYPARYNSYAMRLHRWVRGDWQLLPWLGLYLRDPQGNRIRNPLNIISKWKIIDNMRRSLLNPALLVLIVLGFGVLPGNSLVWISFSLLTMAFPVIVHIINSIITANYKVYTPKRHSTIISGFKAVVYQSMLLFMFIPYQAYLMADAILRTVIRVAFTRKNLLEWVTAADMEANLKNDLKSFWRRMWISPIPGAIILLNALMLSPLVLAAAGLIFAIWIAAPITAYKISKPYSKKVEQLTEENMLKLRELARRTWRYFEDFAGEEDNYLPVDNYQEDPPKGSAHRTSPTNIGLLLVSALSARDLGYMSIIELMEKVNYTITTVEKMDKWRGHLYNWYDTTTLDILRPRYVSTVDSGNFIGYLMVLEQGLMEYLKSPIVDINLAVGLEDTVRLFNKEFADVGTTIDDTELHKFISEGKVDLEAWNSILDNLSTQIEKNDKEKLNKSQWGVKLLSMIDSFKRDLANLVPFVVEKFQLDAYLENLNNNDDIQDVDDEVNVKKDKLPCKLESNISINGLLEYYRGVSDHLNSKILQGNKVKASSKVIDLRAKRNNNAKNSNELLWELSEVLARVEDIKEAYKNLIERINKLTQSMEFAPLYDKKRQLFSIGYDVEEEHLSKSYYDLFASEARQASYIAIARGEVDKRHWFRLGRKLVLIDGYKGLVSWTGTMFEYLMPFLIMRNYENTLLDETYSFVVRNQKRYASKRHIPWGTSESGFNAFDINLNYQYKAFGIPGLGLKRGLENDLVVAPYATILALGIDPVGVIENIKRLEEEDLGGLYGFYEAVDYTPSRLKTDKKSAVVKSFMVHHQGMSMLALNNFLNNNIMQARFHSDPQIKSAELLLQERIPDRVIFKKEYGEEYALPRGTEHDAGEVIRVYGVPDSKLPNVHLLSNGSYSVMLTNGGTGYSKYYGTALSRWKEELIGNSRGIFMYIRNVDTNTIWSAGFEPYNTTPEKYRVVFMPDKAEFVRKDGKIDTHTEIVVSPEDNVEIRRISFTNHGQEPVIIEVTSYFEVVLAHPDEDIAHPAFSNLFVRTEYVPDHRCLLASRRPRSEKQKPVWAFHAVYAENESIGDIQYETDRAKFIGRNRNVWNPAAMQAGQPLTNTQGAVLDPVMSLRIRIKLEPEQVTKLSYMAGITETRENALNLAEKYCDLKTIERAFEMSWTRSQIESRYLGFNAVEVEQYLNVLPAILFPGPQRGRWAETISRNTKAQPDLWPFGISGDIPILLVSLNGKEEIDLVYWALKAHEYWRMKGLMVDLLILMEDESSYTQPLYDIIRDAVSVSHARDIQDKMGGVFIRNARLMSEEDRTLLYTAARVIIKESVELFLDQLKQENLDLADEQNEGCAYEWEKVSRKVAGDYYAQFDAHAELKFNNGIGGFSSDGREYVIHLREGQYTPAPWVNVISNPKFGFQISESGSGYTWAENSRENKITPWSNDPVSDIPGEAFYIRDEGNGVFWTITPMPVREKGDYIVRHGHGYTTFEHTSHGIQQQLTEFVSVEDPVKICIVKLKNTSGSLRELTVTYYVRPVLGVSDKVTAQYISTEIHQETGMMLVKNVFNADYPDRIVYIDTSELERSYTGDRWEFIGVNRNLIQPRAMSREKLSGKMGAGLEPCAAVQIKLTLNEKEEKEVVFLLGQGKSMSDILECAGKYRDPEKAAKELEKVKEHWRSKLELIQVSTPDKSMDVMLNGWLLYQVISCRIWARSAFYQSGGAYGFRDQLQDVMALAYSWPELTRNQILLHSSHQFVEGDVQHWWHPGADKGIRTRYSDDLLWLAYVTADYVNCTGDMSILDEETGYIESEPLAEDEDERYDIPRISQERSNIYEHCVRAVEKALKFGEHGIPLMGSGDWNDGMNTVGNKGKGESVWLGWFLYTVLKKFIPLCQARRDEERAQKYTAMATAIAQAIEANAWDGSWYRRAYFDDGTPLGSVQNSECRIDSISQSWSVISGVGNRNRAEEAMNAVEKYLIDKDEGIIKLLTPPFNESNLKPGYIKGYVPGVRENGGQYTHAAVWVILAFAVMGKGDTAWELFHAINPVNHTRTHIEYSRYKVEPYVMAADVYAIPPHTGRGGWTWYTGAAGWMYRTGIEYILGLKKQGEYLYFDPCIPEDWNEYTIKYKEGKAIYNIHITNPEGVNRGVKKVEVDKKPCEDGKVHVSDDGTEHFVEVVMGNGDNQIRDKG